MFGNRKKIKPRELLMPPPKKQFRIMFEILKDAKKYDSEDEPELCQDTLENLMRYIKKLKLK